MKDLRKIAQLDLNLLVVFRALDETRHATRAAKALGMSQPALSHALARLRHAVGDQLFVKTSKGMTPTARAEAMAKPVATALEALGRELLEGGEFKAERIQRIFSIKTTDMLEGLLLPPLLRTLEAQAPEARLAVTSTGYSLPREELERGGVDLAIAGFYGDLPEGFYQQRLFKDSFACAVRRDHPRLGKSKKISLDQFCDERHVLISPGGELVGSVDQALKKLKRSRNVVAGVSSFTVSGWIAARTDCILTAPRRLIEQLERDLPLKTFAPPLALPEITIMQVWHERSHRDPAHMWLRDCIRQALQD